jgi:hypothetical protein
MIKKISIMKKDIELKNTPFGSGPYGGGVYIAAASITDVLMRLQAYIGLRGDVVEIGVLEGAYLRQLYSFLNEKEICYAIDPYTELPNLKEKVKLDFQSRYGLKNQIHFVYESSLDLSLEMFEREGSPGIRFFSIDGNHTENYVLNDLVLAQKLLINGGIIAVDDYFDRYSPGVSVGMTRYFLENNNGRLAILISGGNKVFLTTKEDYFRYRLLLEKFTNIESVKSCSDIEWFGNPVLFIENILSDILPL